MSLIRKIQQFMSQYRPGFLVSLEGGEGGGKTTQVIRLRDKLMAAGREVEILREPGGTAVSEQIREVVLSNKNIGITFTTEVLLFQAARAQVYEEVVIPSLQAGKVVLMDRTRDSSVVYQGVVRGYGKDMINMLNDISTRNTYPDVTLLLDVPVEIGLARRHSTGESNRLDLESLKFHEDVRQAYLDLVEEDKTGRWTVIDASQSLDEVEAAIWRAVSSKL